MVTLEEVRSWFWYDAHIGVLVRLPDAPLKLTRYRMSSGYVTFSIRGKTYYEHRLAWFYVFGEWPAEQLDHINRVKSDNRIPNLRLCSASENRYNVPKRRHNTTGAKGVVFHPKCPHHPYQAKIVVKGRVISLGYYATVEEAASAYLRGAKQYANQFATT